MDDNVVLDINKFFEVVSDIGAKHSPDREITDGYEVDGKNMRMTSKIVREVTSDSTSVNVLNLRYNFMMTLLQALLDTEEVTDNYGKNMVYQTLVEYEILKPKK